MASNRFQDEFDDLEEERGLLYVATTRAKRELYFLYPVNVYRAGEYAYRGERYRGGDGGFAPTVSRFLAAIPPEILPHSSRAGNL